MSFSKEQHHIVIAEDLFPKIAAGDNEALEELYYLTYRPLYGFILSMTLNKEDADDLLQETYIRIRAAAHLYHPQGNPMAWIMKIAKNLFLMQRRKEKNKTNVSFEEIQDFMDSSFREIHRMEDRHFIEQLFTHITEEEREIILMNVLLGLTFREIAHSLDRPMGTILSKYHRAMKKLKKAAKLYE